MRPEGPAYRCLVTGGTGMLGRHLVDRLEARGFAVASSARRRNLAGLVPEFEWDVGVTAPPRALVAWRPTHVIHTAALTNVDRCEEDPAAATRVNLEGTRRVTAFAADVGARLLHVSTDAVFDGRRGSYRDADPPNPINVYGMTKAQAEEVAVSLPGALVLRLNIIGPTGLAAWVLEHARAGRRISVFTDVVFNPVEVTDLAEALISLLARGPSGICHVGSDEHISKADFARRLVDYAGLHTEARLERVSLDDGNLKAPRPRNTTLVPSDAVRALIGVPSLDAGIRRLAAAVRTESHHRPGSPR